MHYARFLLLALSLFAGTATATAQLPILGNWEIVNTDGSPLHPTRTFTKTISIDSAGNIRSEAWVDLHDGRGPRQLTGETATITPLGSDGLTYMWHNANNTTGILSWSMDRMQFESTVLTPGQHQGRTTAMRRPSDAN